MWRVIIFARHSVLPLQSTNPTNSQIGPPRYPGNFFSQFSNLIDFLYVYICVQLENIWQIVPTPRNFRFIRIVSPQFLQFLQIVFLHAILIQKFYDWLEAKYHVNPIELFIPFSVNQTTATDILDIDDYEKSRNFHIQ